MKKPDLAKQEHIEDLSDSLNNSAPGNLEIKLQEAERQKEALLAVNENLRTSNEQLKKANRDLENFFENIEEVFFSTEVNFGEKGPRFTALQLSASCKKLCGYSAGDFLDNSSLWYDIILEKDKNIIDQHITSLIRGQMVETENRISHKNGEIRWVHTKITPTLNGGGTLSRLNGITSDITKRKLVEKKLEAANFELHKIFDTIDEVLFSVDVINYRLIQISDACEKIYGYRAAEFMADIFLWTKIIHPDDRHIIEGNDEELLKGKTVINQYRIIHKNGNIRWVEAKIIPTHGKDDLLLRKDGIIKDITEKKLVENSLLKSEANLHTLFDNTDTGYLLIDADFRLISFNEQAAKFAKQDLHQILAEGGYTIDYFPAERKKIIKEMMEDALRGNNSNYELNYPQPDGSVIWYNIRLFGVSNKAGEIFALTISLIEITARKLAEDKLNDLNNMLKERAAELAASNEELERFAYVASHDLQEPLRMVSSFLELLQKRYQNQLDDNAQKYINFAVDGAARMKILILDLLNFSRITTVKKDHANINLNEVMRKTLHILQTTLNESGVSVIVSNLPEVYGDESQLMQLFQNLTSNAIKYRTGLNPLMEIGYTEKDEVWEFFIRDNGIGIDAVNFEKIFVIFKRLHNRNEYSGTGIGLAICKKIVELHDGKIWVDSSKEKGSTFYFTIPKLKTIGLKHLVFNPNLNKLT